MEKAVGTHDRLELVNCIMEALFIDSYDIICGIWGHVGCLWMSRWESREDGMGRSVGVGIAELGGCVGRVFGSSNEESGRWLCSWKKIKKMKLGCWKLRKGNAKWKVNGMRRENTRKKGKSALDPSAGPSCLDRTFFHFTGKESCINFPWPVRLEPE